MSHTKQSIDSIKQQLQEAVPPEARLSSQAAVAELLPTITDMRKRGFRLASIASLLKESGLTISEATLKNYIQRAGKRPPKVSTKAACAAAPERATKVTAPTPKKRAAFEPRSDSNDI